MSFADVVAFLSHVAIVSCLIVSCLETDVVMEMVCSNSIKQLRLSNDGLSCNLAITYYLHCVFVAF